MKFFKAAIILALIFLFRPEISIAGSCLCQSYTRYDAQQRGQAIEISNMCYKGLNISNPTDCKESFTDSAGFTYKGCFYCSGDDCQSGTCLTSPLEITDKSCVGDLDCKQKTGTALCLNHKCWMDKAALEESKKPPYSLLSIDPPDYIKPELSINIPGISFTEPEKSVDEEGFMHIRFLAEYIAGFYKFALGAASILAAIVIVLNGFRVAVSAGGEEKNKGIHHVGQALTGLFILWGSYLLFYTINPELVQFKALKVQYVYPEAVETEEDVVVGVAAGPAEITKVMGPNITAAKDVQVSGDTLQALQAAAKSLESDGISLYVSSGYRSVEKQISLIKENCKNAPGLERCDPLQGKPNTCILKGLKAESCPHTTGRAIDVWGKMNGKQCVMQKECRGNSPTDPCHTNECQKKVIEAMRAQGFCNLSFEAWHFERPHMSSACK